jgi:hypothetical protein
MLKLAEAISYVTRHGNFTCPVFVIPFQIHDRVYFYLSISCDFIAAQEGVPEMICMLLAYVFDCKIIHDEGE